MYVDVHKTGMEIEDWNRLVAVIDTGSTHTLVSSAYVERADITVHSGKNFQNFGQA